MHQTERIDQHLSFTDCAPPEYIDKFWEVRQMQDAWRSNMAEIFFPCWVVCLDESMSIWHCQWTCPGFVFCPRKPHPLGNEYHTICCAITGILFDFELVEGKDHQKELPPEMFVQFGKTGGLLLRLTKTTHGSGRYVILDSGFCVLKAIVGLCQHGIFSGALIKKRRYWPALVPGDAIDQYFEDKPVGSAAAVAGKLDGVPYKYSA